MVAAAVASDPKIDNLRDAVAKLGSPQAACASSLIAMVAAAVASDPKIDNLRDAVAKLGEISENEKAGFTNPDRAAVVDLTNPDRAACIFHDFFKWLPVEAMAVADDFFRLSPVERAKLYLDDPAKKMRLPTSLEGQDWLDYLRLHGNLFEQFVPEWPVNPPPFSDVVSPYFNQVRELGFRIYAAIWENPRTNAFMINHTDQLQIVKNEDLEQLGILGSGAFGTVYHAKWRGADVAIKRFGTVPSFEQAQEFWREAEILSKLHHPNVVAFYGVVKDGPGGTLATLTEFMVNGSLQHVLQREDQCPDLRKRLIIAMDAAFGMEYLHSKNIVHFDLKSHNLLVDLRDHSRPICKVCDFGLSKIRENPLVSGGARGTLRWMAPELFNGSKVSEKVDVFSFGIVMWEILTGKVPYARMHEGAILGGIMKNTLRPPVPANCEPEWRMLMEQCWSPDPAERPAFTEIAARLRSMLAAANQQA